MRNYTRSWRDKNVTSECPKNQRIADKELGLLLLMDQRKKYSAYDLQREQIELTKGFRNISVYI